MDKVTPIKARDSTTFRQAVEMYARELPDHLKHAELLAKVHKAQYAAYMREGFTRNEALDLVKAAIRR